MVEPLAPRKPLSTGAKILLCVIGVLAIVGFISGGGFGPRTPIQKTAQPWYEMVTDDTQCDWVNEAFKNEDPPKVRAVAIYIRTLMMAHESETNGQLLERRDDEGKQRLYALPVGICSLKPTTGLYEQVINTYDRIWADDKKWIER